MQRQARQQHTEACGALLAAFMPSGSLDFSQLMGFSVGQVVPWQSEEVTAVQGLPLVGL